MTVDPADEPTPLDWSKDPDRFDPAAAPDLPRDLDPALDPDRFAPPGQGAGQQAGQGRSLPELLGSGAFEGDRDNYQWAFGLLAVLGFLAAVAFLFSNVLSP